MEPHVKPAASSAGARTSMQGNKGKGTRPELLLRCLLREAGYPGYRLHWKKAPGRPDIAYPGRKVAIFVNGCYWHRCPHCHPPMPKAHADFWAAKFVANEARDARQVDELRAAGWDVVTVWECELKSEPGRVVLRVIGSLSQRPVGL
jgi:DNA mismatch endonuclease (patch repair protein)